jgi:hypothetical protein
MTCACLHAQVPALNIFETSLRRGKFDDNRKLSNGRLMEFTHIFPMDAVFDTPADVPEDVGAFPSQAPKVTASPPASCQLAGGQQQAVRRQQRVDHERGGGEGRQGDWQD